MSFDMNSVKKIANSKIKEGAVFLLYIQGRRGYMFKKRRNSELQLVSIKRKAKGYPIRICEKTPVIVFDGEKYKLDSHCPDIQYVPYKRIHWEERESYRYRQLTSEEILFYRERYPAI